MKIDDMKEILAFGDSIFTYGIIIFALSVIGYMIVSAISKKYIFKLINIARDRQMKKGGRAAKSSSTSFDFATKIARVIITAALLVMIAFQIKPLASIGRTLLGATSIIAVVVGFAAQESTANIIGGLFLSFYKPFIKGDLIHLPEKNVSGTIVEVGLRHTTILTVSNSNIIIPNSIMNGAIIENRQEDTKYCNFIIYNISYDSDVDAAVRLIEEEAKAHLLSFKEEYLGVVVSNLNQFAVELKLTVYTRDVPSGYDLRMYLNKAILKAFKANGIKIPYQTQNIHISGQEK